MTRNPLKAEPFKPTLIGKPRIHDPTHQNHVLDNPREASWDLNLGRQVIKVLSAFFSYDTSIKKTALYSFILNLFNL